jgi:hypothetical protein
LNINKDLAYKKIISCVNVNRIKALGKYLFKTKCKRENKVRAGHTARNGPEAGWFQSASQ